MINNAIFLDILLFALSCLASTIVLELLFAFVLRVRRQNLLIVILAQIVTNPIVVLTSNYVFYSVGTVESFWICLIILELLAIVAEGLLYKYFFRDYMFMNPFVLSLVLNLISFLVGVVGYIFFNCIN